MVDYDRLINRAKEKGLSLSFLSQAVGMSRYYINNCKLGKSEIPDSKLQIIAQHLGVSTAYLRGEPVEAAPMNEVDLVVLLSEFRYRPECQLLFSTLRTASPDDVLKAVKIIDALKDTNERK